MLHQDMYNFGSNRLSYFNLCLVILLLNEKGPLCVFLELYGLGDRLLCAVSTVAFVAVAEGKHLYFVTGTRWFGNIYESSDF